MLVVLILKLLPVLQVKVKLQVRVKVNKSVQVWNLQSQQLKLKHMLHMLLKQVLQLVKKLLKLVILHQPRIQQVIVLKVIRPLLVIVLSPLLFIKPLLNTQHLISHHQNIPLVFQVVQYQVRPQISQVLVQLKLDIQHL